MLTVINGRYARIIPWLEPAMLALTAVPALFPGRFSPFFMAAVLFLLPFPFFLRRFLTGRWSRPSPLLWALIPLLLIFIPLSLWASPLPWDVTWPRTVTLLWSTAVFFWVLNWGWWDQGDKQPHPSLPSGLFLLAGSGLTLVGLLGMNGVDKLPLISDLAGLLPQSAIGELAGPQGFHPNEVAGTILLFAPLALAFALSCWFPNRRNTPADFFPRAKPTWLWRIGSLLLLLLFTLTLLLTQSRGGLLAFGVAAFFLMVVKGAASRLLLLGGSGLLLVGVVASGSAVRVYNWLYASVFLWRYSASAYRLEIWRRAGQALADFPLTGTGLGAFRHVLSALYPWMLPQKEGATLQETADVAHAHNLFLQVGLDFGLPGLLLWLFLIGLALWGTWWLFRRGKRRSWAAGLLASLVAYLLYSLTDTVAPGAKPGFTFWFLLGLIAAGWQPAPALSRRLAVVAGLVLVGTAVLLVGLVGGPNALQRNLLARQTAAALLQPNNDNPLITVDLTLAGQSDCRSRYLGGIAHHTWQETAERDDAWILAIACDPDYIPIIEAIIPEHEALARQATIAHPNHAEAYFWLAQATAPTDPAAAIDIYLQGLALAPDDGRRWSEVGRLLARFDDAAAIEAYLQACYNGDPPDGGCREAGRLAEMSGNLEQALAYYRLSHRANALDDARRIASEIGVN